MNKQLEDVNLCGFGVSELILTITRCWLLVAGSLRVR